MMTMQPVIGNVVLKIGSTGLHCEGCMNRIRSKLFKIKGTLLITLHAVAGLVVVYLSKSDASS